MVAIAKEKTQKLRGKSEVKCGDLPPTVVGILGCDLTDEGIAEQPAYYVSYFDSKEGRVYLLDSRKKEQIKDAPPEIKENVKLVV